ncbi:MAG: oligosaccharide flippase family protein [Bacteroidota bacterium]
MKGSFISNLFLSLFLNLLIKPVSLLVIDAEVQNRVGAENYGLYFSLLNLTVLFNILVDLGINNYTIRTMAQDPSLATKHVGRIIVLRLFLFVVYTVFTLLVAMTIGYRGHELALIGILIVNQLLVMFTAYARSYFSGLHYFKTDSVISVFDRFLLIIFCGALLFFNLTSEPFQIEWYIIIQTLCYLITAVVAFVFLSKIIKIQQFTFDREFSLQVIRESIPYALLIVLMLFYTRSDSVILERLHENGRFEAGIYAQGFRLLDALYMFGMVFVMLLFPMFSRILNQSKKEIIPLLQTSGNLLIGGSAVIVIALYFNSETVLNWIYDANISESSKSFKWLMLGFFSLSINFIFGTLLSANGSFRVLNYLAIAAVFFNVGLNIIFSPVYGSEGAAFIFFLTQTGVSLTQFILVKRIIGFIFLPTLVMKHLFVIVPLIITGVYFSEGTSLFVFQILIGSLLLFALRIIDLRELKNSFLAPKETLNNN